MIPGVRRVCLGCGTLTLHGSYCETCDTARKRQREQRRAPKPRGYHQAHARLRRDRGPASSYPCVCGCGRFADEWALRQDKRTTAYAWSDDVMDYEPRCGSSHRALDTRPGG
jgi:hypothetical protein